MTGTPYMVIDFTPEGGVEAMHRENILDLGFLGDQDIRRATDIRFDSKTQKWGIWPASPNADDFLAPPEGAAGFTSYEEARQVEIEWLERCRLFDRNPLSDSGLLILSTLRR